MDWNQILTSLLSVVTNTLPKIIIALLALLISFKIIKSVFKKLDKKLIESGKLDKTLTKALLYAGKILAKCVVVIAIIGFLGIDTTGLSALIASLGVCVGLAVNGTLSNLAGGVMLLITRPFKDDDFIEACGVLGTVEEIRIVSTKVVTLDNKVVYIPNGALSTSTITNYSEKDLRRVDFVFNVAYDTDFEKAKKVIQDVCAAHELVLSDPAPFVRVSKHGESAIEITTRAWCKNADYWDVNFDLIEQVKKAFDEKGIQIPYNQIDVHVKNN